MNDKKLISIFTTKRQKIFSARTIKYLFQTEEDKEDAWQEAFCRLWTKEGEIKNLSHAEALVTLTVEHIGIDANRMRNRHQTEEFSDDKTAGDESSDDCTTHEILAKDLEIIDDNDQDSTSYTNERFEIVKRIIDNELTKSQRTIMQMRDFENKPFEEIAKTLGIEETAVRSQLSRARKKIRECYYKLKSDGNK